MCLVPAFLTAAAAAAAISCDSASHGMGVFGLSPSSSARNLWQIFTIQLSHVEVLSQTQSLSLSANILPGALGLDQFHSPPVTADSRRFTFLELFAAHLLEQSLREALTLPSSPSPSHLFTHIQHTASSISLSVSLS